jgi:hypothetical protein
MARIEKTVFISYRRKDISWALAVYQYLTGQKYDVFFDYTSIPSGDFEQIIVSNIKARAHFILILTPTALDRCSEPGDWLRREIETAIDDKRNIIPLFFDGFSFGSPSVAEKLTGTLEAIKHYNGLDIPSGYFIEAMQRLSNRYLDVPLNAVIHPISTEVRKVVREEQSAVNQALIQKWEDIKELLKPAEEKSVETEQSPTEMATDPPSPPRRSIRGSSHRANFRLFGIGAGILLLAALGIVGINFLMQNVVGEETPVPTPTDREVVDELTLTSTRAPTVTTTTTTSSPPTPIVPTNTAISSPPTPTSELSKGGADKIAFVANNEIWLMNMDGSDLTPLTDDRGAKSDLQWLPDRETILFISGLTVKYVNISTRVAEILTSFPTASSLNAFRVSHNGKQVMISLNNEIFVVPFDFDKMRDVDRKSDLLALDGCPQREPWSEIAVKEALWSANDEPVAWLFKGANPVTRRYAQQVSVLNIKECQSAAPVHLDNFPAGRFSLGKYQITDIDWNGHDLFVFNTSERNSTYDEKSGWSEGWGELYVYDWMTHKERPIKPIDGNVCCYRDARWSPDGNYLFFAFQAYAPNAPTLLYYVLYGEIAAGTNFTPLPLSEGFFKNQKEAPQPALRPAQ